MREELRRAVRDEAWRRGFLRWKLHSEQQLIYDQIAKAEADGEARFVMEIARRFGKTWLLAVLACETCLRNPGVRVVFGAPSLKHLQEFILPTFDAVTADAPPDCRPVFHAQSGHWRFPNGAWTHLFGADDKRKASRGRGSESARNIFDEAGFSPVLDYVLDDVFRATTMHSGGMTLLGSTPADIPDHPFSAIAERAERDGYYARRTIHDNPMLTKERIAEFIAEGAREQGMSVEDYIQTDTFKREYLAQRVTDKRLSVVSEWEEARTKAIQRTERPEFYDAYVALDPGGHDPHALLFMYWDFRNARLVVEGEVLLRDSENSAQIVEAAKAKEKELWGVDKYDGTLRAAIENREGLAQYVPGWMEDILTSKSAPQQPYLRVMDVNTILSKDLYQLHKMAFITTAKDDKEAAVNNLRVLIREGKLVVSPDCPNLDRHLRTTTWKDHKRKEYARKGGEHGDLVDALVYGLRNIDRQRNPFPAEWRQPSPITLVKEAERKQEVTRAFFGDSALSRRLARRGGR